MTCPAVRAGIGCTARHPGPAQLPGPIGDELAALAAQLRTVTFFGGPGTVTTDVAGRVLARVTRH